MAENRAALKPNVPSIFENQTTVMQVAQGEADIAGIFYSKSVYPCTVQGAPVDMCYPREGAFAINWMLDPGVQQLLADANPDRALDCGSRLQARGREVHGVS